MDWTKVKTVVGDVAPWLAGTLSSPVAGVAVKTLCDVFGLSGATATPEDVIAQLRSSSPAQLTALREAEYKHREFMAQIGYSHISQLEKISADDRDSARRRESTIKDRTPAALAWLAILGFVALVIYTATGQSPSATMHDTFMMLSGAAVALAKDVYGYYFGSSAGSRTKDSTIDNLTRGE